MTQFSKQIEELVKMYNKNVSVVTISEQICNLEKQIEKVSENMVKTRNQTKELEKLCTLKKTIQVTQKQIKNFETNVDKKIDAMDGVLYSYDVFQTQEEGDKYLKNIKFVNNKFQQMCKKTPEFVKTNSKYNVTKLIKDMNEHVIWGEQYLKEKIEKLNNSKSDSDSDSDCE